MWLVLLMYALFASVFTVGKITLQYGYPFFLTAVRMMIAGILILGFLRIKSPKALKIKKEHVFLLILLALFNVFITNAFEFWGLQFMQTAKTSLIYSLSPFAAILLSFIFLKEKMSFVKWSGLFIGIAGFLPIFLTSTDRESSIKSSFISISEIAVSISAITAVIGWILMKKLIRDYKVSFLAANGYSFILGSFMSLIASTIFEPWDSFPVTFWPYFLIGVVYIAIVHNVIAYNIYAYSLQRFSVSFMTFAGFSNPLFTAIYGWIFLKETVGVAFFISFFLIFLGIFLYSKAEISYSLAESIRRKSSRKE